MNDSTSARTIAVIIATCNHARLLQRCLESLEVQSRPANEIIVVDDGSTDETPSVLTSARVPGLRVVRQSNQGVSAARNRGLASTDAEYVLFLDDDDTLPIRALEHLTDAIAVLPSPDVAHGDWEFVVDATGKRLSQHASFEDRPIEGLLIQNPIAVHSALVRRDRVVGLGGFRDRQGALEDWELWLRLACAGAHFRHVPRIVAHYHWRAGSGSSHVDRMHAARMAILTEHRAQALTLVDASVWQTATFGAWMDHAVNLFRVGDIARAAFALGEAANLQTELLTQIDTFYRLWRSDYLEALGDQGDRASPERWRTRRQKMSDLLSLLAAMMPAMSSVRAASDWALAQALREDGRPGPAVAAAATAIAYRPSWIRRRRLLRLTGRSLLDSLRRFDASASVELL